MHPLLTSRVLAQHPLAAALALCGATVVGGTIAWTLARMVTPLTGLAVLGAGMGWAALDLNTMAPVIADGHADPNGSVIQCQNTRAHG